MSLASRARSDQRVPENLQGGEAPFEARGVVLVPVPNTRFQLVQANLLAADEQSLLGVGALAQCSDEGSVGVVGSFETQGPGHSGKRSPFLAQAERIFVAAPSPGAARFPAFVVRFAVTVPCPGIPALRQNAPSVPAGPSARFALRNRPVGGP